MHFACILGFLLIVATARGDQQETCHEPSTLLLSADVEWQKRYLSEYDYPDNFVNMQHPEDYVVRSAPIQPEFLYHRSLSGDVEKLIARVSWKANNTYIPMSFILDTTIPNGFYFSGKGFDLLQAHGLMIEDEFGYTDIMVNFGGCDMKPAIVSADFTPRPYEQGNFIGVRGLLTLGLKLDYPPATFSFRCNLTYF